MERDEQLAREVIIAMRKIDDREIEVEEECLKTLALHQPVAIDLRLTDCYFENEQAIWSGSVI